MIPVQLAKYNTNSDNNITLLLPKFKNQTLRFLLIPRNHSQDIHIKLDVFGTSTWLLIDGKNSVENICTKMRQQFGENIEPAEERVTKFLTKLYDNRYITYKQLLDR
jgi:hypothetical protein